MARFSSKTEIEVDDTEQRATLSIWIGNESEAYTIRVLPLTPEEIEDRRADFESDDTHVLKDGYSEDQYFDSFDGALTAAWRYFQETQSQNLEEAGY